MKKTAVRKVIDAAKAGAKATYESLRGTSRKTKGGEPSVDGERAKLSIECLMPSPTNPRKTFEKESISELAASIKDCGLLQPLVVRLAPGFVVVAGKEGKKPGFFWENLKLQMLFGFGVDRKSVEAHPPYEIVCGERRFRALREIGAAAVDVVIRQLTDRQVLAIQAIENEQRVDVLPSERAFHYKRLYDAGESVEQIAELIKKKPTTVREILILAKMPQMLLEAVDAGRVPSSTAALVCRVPGEFARQRAGECVASGLRWYPHWGNFLDPKVKAPKHWGNDQENKVLTHRETKEMIRENCTIELKQAAFSRKALDLVKEAGSCDECPKRAGNDPDLVAEGVRADICTDPACFRLKRDAHTDLMRLKAVAAGKKLLPKEQAQDLFKSYDDELVWDAPFVDLAGHCPYGGSYKELLQSAKDQVVSAINPRTCKLYNLVPIEVAKAILKKEHGINFGGGGSAPFNDRQRDARKKADAGKAARLLACAKVVKKAIAVSNAQLTLDPWLRVIAAALPDILWNDACQIVVKSRKLPVANRTEAVQAVQREANQLNTTAELFALICEMVAARLALPWGDMHSTRRMKNHESDFWEKFGVDPQALFKEAEEAKKAKKPKKGKAAAAA